ncbi:MAG: translation initiation factor [Deltaproteobacteria bacterium]
MAPPDEPPFNNPFGALKALQGELPSREPAAPRAPAGPPPPARAVVRLERKGRRGKEVTVIEGLGLKPRELDLWLSELKRRLGCGGTLEGSALVVQGDSRERVRAFLEEKGVRRISVG